MKLPANFFDVIARGVAVLRDLGARLRQLAAQRSDAPELWLSVRDYESLAWRLETCTDWQRGFAEEILTPLDFAALDELLTDATRPLALTDEESIAIAQLSEFLHRYSRGEYELDDPWY